MASSLIFLLLLSLFSLSSSLQSEPILNAAEILSDSGYTSMALTLELASQTLLPHSPSLTIFAPSDSAFAHSGQPPFSLIQYHLLPISFSFQSLESLPLGAKIATVLPRHLLTVTASPSDYRVALNNVTVEGTPVYDDGSLIIFGIDKFFNPYFQFSQRFWSQSHNLECIASTFQSNALLVSSGAYSFSQASATLRAKGCSVMASFLDIQFLGSQEKPKLTVFAPVDEVIKIRVGNFSEYLSSFFHQHVVPCRLLWGDLVNLDDGTELRTYSEGFTINVSRSRGMLLLNDVPVIYPDMYFSNWLVVHGIVDILEPPQRIKQAPEPPADVPKPNEQVPEPPAEEPKPTEQAVESSAEAPMQAELMTDYAMDQSSAEVPMQAEQMEDYPSQEPKETGQVMDYSNQVPEQIEPMTDYTPEEQEQIEKENSSARNGDDFKENAVGHYHFSVFH
jgi:uncharacterized surface protein with fasciclin (FAS1) repeats